MCSLAMIVLCLAALGGYFRSTWPQELWRVLQPAEVANEVANKKANERRQTPAMNVERNSLGRADPSRPQWTESAPLT